MPFFLSSRLRKTLAWLALCAMCFGAGAPTVSKWLAATARAADEIAVCSEHGIKLAAAPDGLVQAQAPQPGGHHHGSNSNGGVPDDEGDCCPYCTLVHHWPSVPAAAAAFALSAPLAASHLTDTAVSAPALRAWHKPYMPQAPPPVLA